MSASNAKSKEFVHSWVVCDAVWMPKEGKYLCSRTCLVAHNVTVNAAERLPVCRRPSGELEPPHLPTSTATPTPPLLLAEKMLPAPAAAADAASADAAPDSGGADTSGVSSAATTATAAAAATAGAFAADSAPALAPASAVFGSTRDATATSAADTVPVDGATLPPPAPASAEADPTESTSRVGATSAVRTAATMAAALAAAGFGAGGGDGGCCFWRAIAVTTTLAVPGDVRVRVRVNPDHNPRRPRRRCLGWPSLMMSHHH